VAGEETKARIMPLGDPVYPPQGSNVAVRTLETMSNAPPTGKRYGEMPLTAGPWARTFLESNT